MVRAFLRGECAVGLMTRKHARSAATVLGMTVLVLALFVYLPLTVANASDVANGLNYLAIHLALAGAVLMLAGSLPAIDGEYADVDVPSEPRSDVADSKN